MSGLIKPLTQRGRPAASRRTRNPAINPSVASGGGGGGICGSRGDGGGSLFVSSYDEDKRNKYRQQARERTRRYLAWGALLAFVGLAAVGWSSRSSSSSSSEQGGEASAGIRGEGAAAAVVDPPPPPAVAVPPPPPAPPKKTAPVCGYEKSQAKKFSVADRGPGNTVCGREVPVNLSEFDKWPTPHRAGLADVPPDSLDKKEYTLLNRANTFGNLGAQLNSFFHAYDLAHNEERPLRVTQDSWALDTLFRLFFGPESALEKDSKLWLTIQAALGVKVIKSEAAETEEGWSAPQNNPPNKLFYVRPTGADVTATKIRDHRNTILRKLLQYPAWLGENNSGVCSAVEKAGEKYTVIHVASADDAAYLGKFNAATKRDHSAALAMSPEYAKSILSHSVDDALWKDVYLIDGSTWSIASKDSEEHARMAKDPDIAGRLRQTDADVAGCMGANVYLAVLADVYLGSPVSHLSLWIARMRFALGKKNTFVMMEKRDGQWVSYLDDGYLDLYQNLGPWMG